MEKRFWKTALDLLLVSCALLSETYADTAACRRPSAGEVILDLQDTCFPWDYPAAETGFEGVFEGGEIALQRAISIVHKNREQHIAVLFHASWCPFSKICRPNFSAMASLFPTIPHFAFEESMIRPSILARHGVHGFPTLFLLNSTMRVRYRGPRSISFLADFYSDVTGVKPPRVDPSTSNKTITLPNLDEDIQGGEEMNLPFSWARTAENLLQRDAYLALAGAFVLLRLLYFLLPKLSSYLKTAGGWRITMRLPILMSLWEYSQAFLEQVRMCLDRQKQPGKRMNLQEGAMSAKAWVSKSLVSVSVGEPSSGRVSSPLQ